MKEDSNEDDEMIEKEINTVEEVEKIMWKQK